MSNSNLFILAGNAGYYNRGSEAIIRGTVRILREHYDSPKFLCVSHFKTDEQFREQAASEKDKSIVHKKMYSANKRFDYLWFLTKSLGVVCPDAVKHVVYKELKFYLPDAKVVLAVGGDNYSLDYSANPKTCTDLDDLVVNNGKPLVIWGSSVGPFSKKPDYEKYMINHLRKVHIFARETETIKYLASKGLKENVYRVADPAFVMEATKPEVDKFDLDIEPRSIGVNLSPLMARFVSGGDVEKWTTLATDIIRNIARTTGRKIYLIPHVMAKESNDDYLFLCRILSSLKEMEEQIILIPPSFDASELKWIISKMAMFAGARTHSTIAALSSCVPTLSFAYSIKANGINKDVYGHTDYCIGPDELNAELTVAKVKRLLFKADDLKSHLESRIPEIQRLAIGAGSILKKILDG